MYKECGGETCKVCEMNCYIRGLKDFLVDHKGEVDTFILDLEMASIGISSQIAKIMGVSVVKMNLLSIIQFALLCGYFKGRTYQDVPEVWKKEIDGGE